MAEVGVLLAAALLLLAVRRVRGVAAAELLLSGKAESEGDLRLLRAGLSVVVLRVLRRRGVGAAALSSAGVAGRSG